MISIPKTIVAIIILGLVAACTPAADHNTNKPADNGQETAASVVQPNNNTPEGGKYCFLSATNKDTTKISLLIVGDKVSGTMDWQPWEKDGARGTLSGTKQANGELDLVYDYMIEGSRQTETKIMKIEGNSLLVKHGSLIDPKNDGNLHYDDPTKAVFSETLSKTDCH